MATKNMWTPIESLNYAIIKSLEDKLPLEVIKTILLKYMQVIDLIGFFECKLSSKNKMESIALLNDKLCVVENNYYVSVLMFDIKEKLFSENKTKTKLAYSLKLVSKNSHDSLKKKRKTFVDMDKSNEFIPGTYLFHKDINEYHIFSKNIIDNDKYIKFGSLGNNQEFSFVTFCGNYVVMAGQNKNYNMYYRERIWLCEEDGTFKMSLTKCDYKKEEINIFGSEKIICMMDISENLFIITNQRFIYYDIKKLVHIKAKNYARDDNKVILACSNKTNIFVLKEKEGFLVIDAYKLEKFRKRLLHKNNICATLKTTMKKTDTCLITANENYLVLSANGTKYNVYDISSCH